MRKEELHLLEPQSTQEENTPHIAPWVVLLGTPSVLHLRWVVCAWTIRQVVGVLVIESHMDVWVVEHPTTRKMSLSQTNKSLLEIIGVRVIRVDSGVSWTTTNVTTPARYSVTIEQGEQRELLSFVVEEQDY